MGYTTAPTLTQLRRDRARLRLDSIGRSMQSQIERAITAASSGKQVPGAWGGGGWQNMDFAEGALVGGAGAQVKEIRKEDPASRCPWPFVFFHDPLTGMKDWQTWFMIGIALCWCYSQL